MKNNDNVPVVEAAERMGVSIPFVREGLESGKFPFGTGYRISPQSKRRTFYINRALFEKHMNGELSMITGGLENDQ